MTSRIYDVIVIGAGAAGLMCAVTAARRGRRVLVLERANKVGKKILMSGGGRCNFTNLHLQPDRFISGNPHFCKSALSRYTQWDFIALVEKHGIAYHEKIQNDKAEGQLFCDTSSRQIVDMLLGECDDAGVEIMLRCEIQTVSKPETFQLDTDQGRFDAASLVVASGGLSIPKMGGSGFGYELARQFGHRVIDTRAGLVPFTFTDAVGELCQRLSGVSVQATASCGNRLFHGPVLFTHRGLSGPAILQISSYWQPGHPVSLNLLPELDARQCLLGWKQQHPGALLRTPLAGVLARKLVAELESMWWAPLADRPLAQWRDRELTEIADRLSDWPLKPAATEGYRTAEVTLGGVDTGDLSSKTMMSNYCDGLYFIGEVVDVTGHLGGFNFQWAWSSGWVAGQYA